MATHNKTPIICKCGHTGFIKTAENDQPFSKEWTKHSLEGFEGATLSIEGYKHIPNMIEALSPRCPHCGELKKVTYIKQT